MTGEVWLNKNHRLRCQIYSHRLPKGRLNLGLVIICGICWARPPTIRPVTPWGSMAAATLTETQALVNHIKDENRLYLHELLTWSPSHDFLKVSCIHELWRCPKRDLQPKLLAIVTTRACAPSPTGNSNCEAGDHNVRDLPHRARQHSRFGRNFRFYKTDQ